MTIKTTSAQKTKKFGREFAREIKNGGVICLYGGLGAGKTTLIQGIAGGLGIKNRIISPTFILMRQYKMGEKYLYHLDLYRLNDIDEAKAIGIEEIMEDKNNIVLIEWPEKIQSLLPKKRWQIKIDTLTKLSREVNYEAIY